MPASCSLAGEGGQATVRLAHARVLDSWQRASKIVADNAAFYRIRDRRSRRCGAIGKQPAVGASC